MFFTKGVGHHRNKLQSFEIALRDAGIEKCNLVTISSIFPPNCIIISKSKGLTNLVPGQITFVVLARECTNEPSRLISAAVGLARPVSKKHYGYAEDLAATMLASTLGIEMDPDKAWDERKQLYIMDKNRQFTSRSIAQCAHGHKLGLWTTVLACAVMLVS